MIFAVLASVRSEKLSGRCAQISDTAIVGQVSCRSLARLKRLTMFREFTGLSGPRLPKPRETGELYASPRSTGYFLCHICHEKHHRREAVALPRGAGWIYVCVQCWFPRPRAAD